MSHYVVFWLQIVFLVIFCGSVNYFNKGNFVFPELFLGLSKINHDKKSSVVSLTQNVTNNGEQVTVSPINNSVLSMLSLTALIPTSHSLATGRYAIERIIMEEDNVPLLSQNGPEFTTLGTKPSDLLFQ